MERVKGTYIETLTGMMAMPHNSWWERLGLRFAKWLGRICGEPQYRVGEPIAVTYKISPDGKRVNASVSLVTFTSEETEMTITGMPSEILPEPPK